MRRPVWDDTNDKDMNISFKKAFEWLKTELLIQLEEIGSQWRAIVAMDLKMETVTDQIVWFHKGEQWINWRSYKHFRSKDKISGK